MFLLKIGSDGDLQRSDSFGSGIASHCAWRQRPGPGAGGGRQGRHHIQGGAGPEHDGASGGAQGGPTENITHRINDEFNVSTTFCIVSSYYGQF